VGSSTGTSVNNYTVHCNELSCLSLHSHLYYTECPIIIYPKMKICF
jgi:hypothetical protein